MSNLEKELILLQKKLRDKTKEKYDRVNPFVEDITNWKERGEYLFGKNKNITVYNTSTIVGDVQVGENTWIGPYTALDGGKAGINIGSNCSISSGVNIIGHDSVKWALSGGKEKYEYASVSIGNNCFIGTNVIITKGVSIGNHCLVGANTVVTKSFPDNSIIFGIPGRIAGKVLIDKDGVRLDYENNY
jgi:acetyltransferase-like isoleucine patch superfamily enzyme